MTAPLDIDALHATIRRLPSRIAWLRSIGSNGSADDLEEIYNAWPAIYERLRELEAERGIFRERGNIEMRSRQAWQTRARRAEALLLQHPLDTAAWDALTARAERAEDLLRSLITDGKLDDPEEIKRRLADLRARTEGE